MASKSLMFFKKNPKEVCKEDFNKMNLKDRKTFLSNDFIERMIRVEQRVSLSFGQYIPYRKTKYYQSLTNCEKLKFEKFLNKRHKPKKMLLLFIFIGLISLGIFKIGITGNAINNTLGSGADLVLSYGLTIFILVAFLFLAISFVLRKKKEKHYSKKFEVIDKIISSRR